MTNEAPEKQLPEDIIHACPDYIIIKREGDTRSHIIRTQQIDTMYYQPKENAEDMITIFLKTDSGYIFNIDCTVRKFDYFIKEFIRKFAGLSPPSGFVALSV